MKDSIRQERFLKKLEAHKEKLKSKGIDLNISSDYRKKYVYLNDEASAKNDILARRFEAGKKSERERTGKKRINVSFETWKKGKDVSMVDIHKEMLGDMGLIISKKQASPAAKGLRAQGWKGMTINKLMYSEDESTERAREAGSKYVEGQTAAERQRIAFEDYGKTYDQLSSKELGAVNIKASTIIAEREFHSPD